MDPAEVAGHDVVYLGTTVLRAETAAIAAGTLLTALRDGRVTPPL
jgi:16S rRNA U1498 N3-methylase RsmE